MARGAEIRDCPSPGPVTIQRISAIRWRSAARIISSSGTSLQLLPTLAVNLGSFSSGLALGFPAHLLPHLSEVGPEEVHQVHLVQHQPLQGGHYYRADNRTGPGSEERRWESVDNTNLIGWSGFT